ncbi:hypothetical protein [Lysobacter gummosus]
MARMNFKHYLKAAHLWKPWPTWNPSSAAPTCAVFPRPRASSG